MSENYREPRPGETESPLFNAIWDAIKKWDISRESTDLYAGATGNDVCRILDAIEGVEDSPGLAAISRERRRQQDVEGWDAEHDGQHVKGELALAAALYASPIKLHLVKAAMGEGNPSIIAKDPWPWDKMWDKRKEHSYERRLVIAGALIAAELDRLGRLKALGNRLDRDVDSSHGGDEA